jgi:hypothetical protein
MVSNWNLQPVELRDLSDIAVSYRIASSDNQKRILVVSYTGEYRPGSAGNSDAAFMCGASAAGVNAFSPDAIIFDFSKLKYAWGDMLETVYATAPTFLNSEKQRFAVVVGSGCEEAIRTLELGVNSKEPVSAIAWVHQSIESACRYLEENAP